MRLLSALEIGSHAHLGAALAAGFTSEMALAPQLLSSLPANSLVLQDSGFRGAWWIQRLMQAGHDSMTRLHADDYACQGQRLYDGSYLVQTQSSQALPLPEPLTLRIIEYRLDLCFLTRPKPGKILSAHFMAVTFLTRFFLFEWH